MRRLFHTTAAACHFGRSPSGGDHGGTKRRWCGILPEWRTGHGDAPAVPAGSWRAKCLQCNGLLTGTWQQALRRAPDIVDFTPQIVDSRLQNDDLTLTNEDPGSSKRRYEASTRRLEASTRRFQASILRPAVCNTTIRRFKMTIPSFKRSIQCFKKMPKWLDEVVSDSCVIDLRWRAKPPRTEALRCGPAGLIARALTQ